MFRFREIKPSFSNRLNTRLVCSGVTASNSAISHCLKGREDVKAYQVATVNRHCRPCLAPKRAMRSS